MGGGVGGGKYKDQHGKCAISTYSCTSCMLMYAHVCSCMLIRGRPHLGGVLAREGSAAVCAPAAVCVDDDLAASQAGVAVGPADDETTRRVQMVHGLRGGRAGGWVGGLARKGGGNGNEREKRAIAQVQSHNPKRPEVHITYHKAMDIPR